MKNILCKLGWHKWKPVGEVEVDWKSKWEAYEVSDGVCIRCSLKEQIRREYYW